MIRTSVCNQVPHQMAAGVCSCEHRYSLAPSAQASHHSYFNPLASAALYHHPPPQCSQNALALAQLPHQYYQPSS